MSSEPELYGRDLFGEPIEPPKRGAMADTFVFPPFSVLNAREGFWQDRKRAWLALGIQSEIGRGTSRPHNQGKDHRLGTTEAEYNGGDCWRGTRQLLGGSAWNNDWQSRHSECTAGQNVPTSGASVFDPVLCELCYRWFCPADGIVLDPFAGGSVRGIVAALLGRRYVGIELRPEQIQSNQEQAAAICDGKRPEWIEGDAIDVSALTPRYLFDFLFSCPPYGNLERYSDDPRDLSTLDYKSFVAKYRQCVAAACARLKENRFACFVVGDFRDVRGNYVNFVSDTIAAFLAAGLKLYNEAILVTCVGSLPIRAGKQFTASRKLGKTHQNVLVFVKGDGQRAAKSCEEYRDA